MSSSKVKSEPAEASDFPDGPEGLLPEPKVSIPVGFSEDEWAKLTMGFNNEEDEVNSILGARGQVGSMKGRPTNLTVGFKGTFSNSVRAIQQRDRAAMRSTEDHHIAKARASDRSAKLNLKKKLKKNPAYQASSTAEKRVKFEEAYETLSDMRFKNKRSAEWLESSLSQVHSKWDKIQHQIDLRKHDAALEKKAANNKTLIQGSSRVEKTLFSSGGLVEKLMRKEYMKGLSKLNTNSFRNKEEKAEWEGWRDQLSPEDLAMVTSEEWQEREPTPLEDLPEFQGSTKLKGSLPYYKGNESDECEEEVDYDSDVDAMLAEDDDYDDVQESDEESWNGFPDSPPGSGDEQDGEVGAGDGEMEE